MDISWLIEGHAAETWHAADPQLQCELIHPAIDNVVVAKSEMQGGRFKGDERVTITWAVPEGPEPDADGFGHAA